MQDQRVCEIVTLLAKLPSRKHRSIGFVCCGGCCSPGRGADFVPAASLASLLWGPVPWSPRGWVLPTT